MNEQGVLIFAHNNTEIDYVRIAVANAYLVRHHMGKLCALVTDSTSWGQTIDAMGEIAEQAFSHVIFNEKDTEFKYKNLRSYRDTVHVSKSLSFYNLNRSEAYALSPFTETLLIDADYLIMGDSLNTCWGSVNDIMINHSYVDVFADREFPDTKRVCPLGIDMSWATAVYFRKSVASEIFFSLVNNVRENYEYYSKIYKLPRGVYRNDYVFSIANHMFCGFGGEQLPELPVKLINSFDRDDVHELRSLTEIVMKLEKPGCDGDFVLGTFKYNNIHIMNKWALRRISDQILEYIHG